MFTPNKYGDRCIVVPNLFSVDWLVQRVQNSMVTVRVLAAAFYRGYLFPWKEGAGCGIMIALLRFFPG
jgi:hypothetical protein